MKIKVCSQSLQRDISLKIPYTTILNIVNPNYHLLINNYVIASRKNATNNILEGIFDKEFDQLLENDDLSGIIDKLNLGGTVDNVIEKAIEKIRMDIKAKTQQIANYKADAPKHIAEKSNRELESMKVNLEKNWN